MKNTVKKILALVFAVVMVCSLAVPALAADDEGIKVYVTVVDVDGKVLGDKNDVIELTAKNQNVEKALKSAKDAGYLNIVGGKITKLNGVSVASETIEGEFGTGSVVVAVNGKAVSEDLGTVALEDGDLITVYWADSTLGTKLAMVDESRLDEGIISLYYVDAEGNRQPLVGAYIALRKASNYVLRDKTNVVNKFLEDKIETNDDDAYEFHFVTDEKGQIWIAPEYLDGSVESFWIDYAAYNNKAEESSATTYAETIIDTLKEVSTKQGYTEKEKTYYNDRIDRNIEDVLVLDYVIDVDAEMYNTADATGDMTMVYVLVAAAAVITLAAVVVMKKKAVKAN